MNEKLVKLRKEMSAAGMTAALITSEINQFYLTDFAFSGYLLVLAAEAFLITDPRYSEAARAAVGSDFTVVVPEDSRAALVRRLLSERNIRHLAYENHALTCAAFAELEKDFPDIEFVPLERLLYRLRERKDERELRSIQAAQAIADAAFYHILKMVSPHMTEIELAVEIEYFMRKQGAEEKSFDTVCVSGRASALPHGVPRAQKLEPGFLTLDFGAKVGGYCSDMTRTVVVGRADAEMKKLYETVLAAQQAALEAVRPGALCRAVDGAARTIIDNAGYRGCFGHGTGHGVGLQIHEAPRLSPSAGDAVLVPGHVVTVEPGIYLEGKYGCRIEDMVALTADGCLNLTQSPKELIELF